MNTPDIQPSLLQKVSELENLVFQVKAWRTEGLSIGFTNGVFDLIHIGHVNYLQEASTKVDRLIIGLNSDASVRRLNKGPERPINPQDSRAIVLAGLSAVSALCVFEEDNPLRLIEAILPDVLMKGGDYDTTIDDLNHPAYIVGAREVKAAGGKVLSIPFVPGFSTTDIVNKLRADSSNT